jgi:monofunctional glycosyltransferase
MSDPTAPSPPAPPGVPGAPGRAPAVRRRPGRKAKAGAGKGAPGPRGAKARGGLGQLVVRLLVIAALVPVMWVLVFRFVPIPGTSLMIERALAGDTIVRSPRPIGEISPNLIRAVIAAEDSRFCRHAGFEWEAMRAAFEANQQGKRLRGASTISQQTAKNVFLWSGRSYLRKAAEVPFTMLMELFWPKRRIMEAYLNVAEWGDGVFGAEAAARHHFGKSARSLTPREAARLAAVLPSPRRWSASRPSSRVARRAARIERSARIVRDSGLDACIRGEKVPGQ